MPQWIHDRAAHIRAKNPEMEESTSWALATQQAHKLGKTPKGYGTPEGRKAAKAKYALPRKEYKKTAAPKVPEEGQKTPTMPRGVGAVGGVLGGSALSFGSKVLGQRAESAFFDALEKERAAAGAQELFTKVRASAKVPVVDMPGSLHASFFSGTSFPLREMIQKVVPDPAQQQTIFDGLAENPALAMQDAIAGAGHPLRKPAVAIGEYARTPGVVAHELGHSAIHHNRIGRLIQNTPTALLAKARGPLGGALGAYFGATSKNSEGGADAGKALRNAALGAGALTLPQLAYEGSASLLALRKLKRLGATAQQLRAARRTLLPAFGTYAGDTLSGMGAGLQGAGLGLLANRPKEKTAGLGAIKPIKPLTATNTPFLPKGVAGTKMDPRRRFQESSSVGYQKPFDQKTDGIQLQTFKPLSMAKVGFQTSMYSGPLSWGHFITRSNRGMPHSPGGIKVSGPPPPPDRKSEKKEAAVTVADLGRFAGTAGALGALSGARKEYSGKGALGGGAGAAAGALTGGLGAALLTRRLPARAAYPLMLGTAAGGALLGARQGAKWGDAAEGKTAELWKAAAFSFSALGAWQEKQAAVISPKSQLTSAQSKFTAPKTTTPPGPSIAQISKPRGFGTPLAGATKTAAEKEAALRELLRVGLKDVPNTPRLLMRHRDFGERLALATRVGDAYDAKVSVPFQKLMDSGLAHLPEGRVKETARPLLQMMARDPLGHSVSRLSPVPGTSLLYEGGKRLLERAANKIDPLPFDTFR